MVLRLACDEDCTGDRSFTGSFIGASSGLTPVGIRKDSLLLQQLASYNDTVLGKSLEATISRSRDPVANVPNTIRRRYGDCRPREDFCTALPRMANEVAILIHKMIVMTLLNI